MLLCCLLPASLPLPAAETLAAQPPEGSLLRCGTLLPRVGPLPLGYPLTGKVHYLDGLHLSTMAAQHNLNKPCSQR